MLNMSWKIVSPCKKNKVFSFSLCKENKVIFRSQKKRWNCDVEYVVENPQSLQEKQSFFVQSLQEKQSSSFSLCKKNEVFSFAKLSSLFAIYVCACHGTILAVVRAEWRKSYSRIQTGAFWIICGAIKHKPIISSSVAEMVSMKIDLRSLKKFTNSNFHITNHRDQEFQSLCKKFVMKRFFSFITESLNTKLDFAM